MTATSVSASLSLNWHWCQIRGPIEGYELCAPSPYVVVLDSDAAQTASRRICTILPDELLMVARSQRAEPRQLIPRAELLPRRVVRVVTPSIRNEEVCMMELVTDRLCVGWEFRKW